MTDINPLAQLEAEREILRLSGKLSTLTEEIATAAQAAAQADVDHKIAWAKAIYKAPGRVVDKESAATMATEDELREAKLTEATYRALQEAGRNIRTQLDALRSVNANIRQAVDYSHGRGG